jgi:hypothetical protein
LKTKLKNINYESKVKALKPVKREFLFYLLSAFLLFCILISPAAAAIEWKISPCNPTVGDTLKIKGTASPGESIKAVVSFEQNLTISDGRYQYLLEEIRIPEGSDNLFTVKAEGAQNLNVGVNKLIWINLTSEGADGVATISQSHVPPFTYKILIDGDALGNRSHVNLVFTASQTLKADFRGRFKYKYDTSSMPAGKFNITIGNLEKTVELRSKEQKKPVSEFSATPISGEAPLKVRFTDNSKGSPTSWKWYFGDRMYSVQQNPVHTYSKAGKYTVILKTKNANGMDTETKAKYIVVSKENDHQSKNKNVKTEDIDDKEKQKKEK